MYSDLYVINALHSVELKDNRNYSKIYDGMKEWFEKNKLLFLDSYNTIKKEDF
jgi:hypothetical protein